MMKIDARDAAILRELERGGRISNVELAGLVGLSPSACLRRVQELEHSGVIKGYRAVIDRTLLDIGFVAYLTVGLSEHTFAAQKGFEEAMSLSPEVRECHNITGGVEYLLRIETSSLQEYKRFHTERLGTIAHVRSLTTYVVMESSKDERA